jgi:hypothetical protein
MRTKSARAVLSVVVAAGLALVACSDRSITSVPAATVQQTDAQGNLLGGLLGGLTQLLFQPLQRSTPLAQDVTWSFTAGPAGAASSNASVGLTIVIPANALSTTRTITVTALAGAPVAYRFEPHLVFNKKIYLTQNLNGTSVGLLGSLLLKGAHFPGSTPVYTSGGLAIVDEIVSGLTLPWAQTVTIGVNHFTGWIVGTGYSTDSADGGY